MGYNDHIFENYTYHIFIMILCILSMLVLFVCNTDKFKNVITTEKKIRWKNEARVGELLKFIFPEHNFKKIRPDWLRNPKTGKNLEIDFYCKKLNLAVEVDGKQHFRFNAFFHKDNPINFIKQIQRDSFKKNQCKKFNVKLLSIPYTIDRYELYSYIVSKLIEMNLIK